MDLVQETLHKISEILDEYLYEKSLKNSPDWVLMAHWYEIGPMHMWLHLKTKTNSEYVLGRMVVYK